jgi:PST family polysaccharide transporter
VVAAAIPICVLLGVLAEPIISLVYGANWTAAAVPLQFLVALGLLRVAVELAYDGLAARVRKTLMVMQGWWLLTLVPVLVLFAHFFGVVGVAAGHVVVAGLLVAPVFVVVLGRLGIPARELLRSSVRPALGGLAMGLVAWGVHRLVGSGFVGLTVTGLAACAAYVPFVLPLVARLRDRDTGNDAGADSQPIDLAVTTAEPA